MSTRRTRRSTDASFALEGDLEGSQELVRLEEGLAVSRADLDAALAEQPSRFYAAALAAARLAAELEYAEDQYQAALVRVESMIREALVRRGEDPAGIDVTHRVRSHSDVAAAAQRVREARRVAAVAGVLRDAYAQRADALLALAGRAGGGRPARSR